MPPTESKQVLPGVSIVIVNWNTRELLRDCLHSVYRSTNVTLEVIVVDNASTDGSAEMITEEFPQAVLIRNTANLGFAAANNIGFRFCSQPLILLLNSDTIVDDDAIASCVACMQRHQRAGVLGCRVVYPDGTFQSSYFRFERLSDVFLTQCLPLRPLVLAARRLGLPRLNFPSRYWGAQYSTDTPVDVVAGCFFLARREVIAQAGPLDEDFFFYGEEEEWCFRIKQAGWSIMYHPHAKIVHIHGASSKKMHFRANLTSRRARLIVFEKTRGTAVAWFANCLMLFGALLRFPLWLLLVISSRLGLASNRNFAEYTSLVRFHLAGLVKPAWRPAARGPLLAAKALVQSL